MLEVTTCDSIEMCIYYYYYYFFFLTLVKTRVGKKLRKVERGLKWKTSPGGPQREIYAGLEHIDLLLLLLLLLLLSMSVFQGS